jgi:carbon monoxide dehydrogenase subunit G
MLIENGFTVAAPVDDLWAYLLDVERIAPCMPGAELTETVDERTWKGNLKAKFGPVTMAFAGTVAMESRDDVAHRVVLKARGMEQKGKGAAEATVTSWLEPGDAEDRTTVRMQAEIVLTGAAAQLSRGLLPEISKKLTQQFADCLQAGMAAEGAVVASEGGPPVTEGAEVPGGAGTAAAPRSPAPPVASRPVGGLRLGLSALWAIVRNFFRKLFRRSPAS